MSSNFAILVVLVALAPLQSSGQTAPVVKIPPAGVRKILVEPSSTTLAGGKARLNVPTLTRQPDVCVGNYQLQVTPYFFKSEKGRISITVPDQALLKLTENTPVELSGNATTAGTGKTRPITVNATPSGKDRGALKISVTTENGALVFNTSYRFADK